MQIEKPALFLAGVALASSLETPLAAQQAGTANGTYTVAGKTTKLNVSYAIARKGFFDEKKEDVLIILSDVALPQAALNDQFERMHMARDGKLHAVELTVNSEKQVTSGTLLHEAFVKYQGSVSATGMHQFDAKTFDGKTAAGKLSTSRPSDFQDIAFAYSATFEAPIYRKPPPSMTGAAAKDSAPAKAVLALYKAARAGDVAAVRKALTPESAKTLDGPEAKEAMGFLKATSPDPAAAEIESVDVKGDKAEVVVVVRSKDGKETSTMNVEKIAGQWKVAL
jgi:hypothetical protein